MTYPGSALGQCSGWGLRVWSARMAAMLGLGKERVENKFLEA